MVGHTNATVISLHSLEGTMFSKSTKQKHNELCIECSSLLIWSIKTLFYTVYCS
jgi:hypothetical protein